MLNAKLVVVGGNAQYEQIDLKLPVVLGRGTDVDLAMPDELISRRHAEIFEDKGRLFVRDLGSRNGTFVNNQRIESVSSLEPEQLLTLGTLTFRAIYDVSDHLDSAQVSETVRINFNSTEPIRHPSKAEDQNRNSQDDLETVDLEEYVNRPNSGELPKNFVSRKTTFASPGTDPQVSPVVDMLSTLGVERPDVLAQSLKRRFPK